MKIHWHPYNPWRSKIIYVPLSELMPLTDFRYRMNYGPKLDAYIIVQADGQHESGIRYGARSDQYIAPAAHMTVVDLVALREKHQLQWRPCDWEDEMTRPTIAGRYFFQIAGDSESDGPHVFYDFDDYTTTGQVVVDEDGARAYGDTDEQQEHIIAWYGPMIAPPCDVY